MVVLGLLLLAASVGIGGYIAAINTDSLTFEAFGQTYASSMYEFFLCGAVLGALAVLGLWMVAAGLRHSRRRHVEDKEVVIQTRSRVDELEDENAQLRDELGRQRDVTDTAAMRTPVVQTGVLQTAERDGVAENTVYPEDPQYGDREAPVATPAYEETARGGRYKNLFGRSRER